MRKPPKDDHTVTPFPTSPVSNGEWLPLPITAKQRLVAKLIAEETTARAKRHGMTRGQFLRTAAATATAFMVMNKVYGLDQTGDAAAMPMRKEHCDDPAAGRELLDTDVFVMDVQQHHVDLNRFNSPGFCFLQFVDSDLPCPESIGQKNFIKEVYVDSQTNVGVISGLPAGVPQGPASMAATRDLVNQLAGSERALAQAVCDPLAPANQETAIASLEHQVKVLKGRALKCYTYSYNGWRLDDEKVAYPMLHEISRLGLKLVNVHKGLPAVFAPGSPETVRTTDFPKVVRDWPHLKFCAYHSGYFQGTTHPEGKNGLTEWLEILQSIPKRLRRNVYSEIGSTFAITFLNGPDQAAHLIGQLLKALGARNILWGTDSVWWGSPQWLIDAFKTLQIPASMQEQFGYPPLTDKVKRRILGLNAARLYGVKPNHQRCKISDSQIQQLQEAQGGMRAGRSLRWYGPQTRREFLAMFGRLDAPG
jgi:predicted TIM-barrel fold metal-dependent hydrolase